MLPTTQSVRYCPVCVCVCRACVHIFNNIFYYTQLQLALTYASRSGNSVIADRINDIICRRESLPSLSDDEDLSCNEEQEVTEQSSSVASSRQRISSNSFRLLKKLPSSYKSSFHKETTATKKHTYQQQDDDNYDALSDDSCGTRNDIPGGSHDQEATPVDEENNTLQLFDDNEDTNSDTQEKPREPVAISKRIKPSLGEIFVHICVIVYFSFPLIFSASQSLKANPFKVD